MDSPRATDFEALIARVARALREREIPFMLIGGQAVLLHGEPRLTRDVDVTLGLPRADLPRCEQADLEPLPADVVACSEHLTRRPRSFALSEASDR